MHLLANKISAPVVCLFEGQAIFAAHRTTRELERFHAYILANGEGAVEEVDPVVAIKLSKLGFQRPLLASSQIFCDDEEFQTWAADEGYIAGTVEQVAEAQKAMFDRTAHLDDTVKVDVRPVGQILEEEYGITAENDPFDTRSPAEKLAGLRGKLGKEARGTTAGSFAPTTVGGGVSIDRMAQDGKNIKVSASKHTAMKRPVGQAGQNLGNSTPALATQEFNIYANLEAGRTSGNVTIYVVPCEDWEKTSKIDGHDDDKGWDWEQLPRFKDLTRVSSGVYEYYLNPELSIEQRSSAATLLFLYCKEYKFKENAELVEHTQVMDPAKAKEIHTVMEAMLKKIKVRKRDRDKILAPLLVPGATVRQARDVQRKLQEKTAKSTDPDLMEPQPGDYRFTMNKRLTANSAIGGKDVPVAEFEKNTTGPSLGKATMHGLMYIFDGDPDFQMISGEIYIWKKTLDPEDARQELIRRGFVEDTSITDGRNDIIDAPVSSTQKMFDTQIEQMLDRLKTSPELMVRLKEMAERGDESAAEVIKRYEDEQ